MVKSGPLFDEVHRAITAKYGFMVPITKFLGKVMGQRKAGQQYADTCLLYTSTGSSGWSPGWSVTP